MRQSRAPERPPLRLAWRAVTQLPHLRLYRQGTALALLVAPMLFLVDNLIHPKEYTRGHEAEQLADIADAYGRWQLAHFLGFLAIVGFAAAVLGLAFMVRRRWPGLGLAAGALGIAGLLGLAAVVVIDGYAWGILGEVSDRPGVDPATVELALKDMQESEWSLPYYLLPLGWIVSLVTLAVSAVRMDAVARWAGVLLGLGAVTVGLEAAIQDNAYFIASAAVLAIGGAAVGLELWRMSDREFAGERRVGPRAEQV
jgi:hypothetical protein